MNLDPSIIVIGGCALGGLAAYCMIRKHKAETNAKVRPMFVKSDDVLYLPFNRRATVLDVRVKSGQAQYNLDLFGFNEWINEGDLVRWQPKPAPKGNDTYPFGGPPSSLGERQASQYREAGRSPVARAAQQARASREERRRSDSDDILSNPIHPLNPISPLNAAPHRSTYDDAPSRSSYDDCGSSRSSSHSHSSHSHSCSSSSSSDSSSSSSSDSGSSSSD